MIIITKNKREKKYVKKEMPEFNSRHESVAYYRREKKMRLYLILKVLVFKLEI